MDFNVTIYSVPQKFWWQGFLGFPKMNGVMKWAAFFKRWLLVCWMIGKKGGCSNRFLTKTVKFNVQSWHAPKRLQHHQENKYDSQIGSSPQVGAKIKSIWNHHLENLQRCWTVKDSQISRRLKTGTAGSAVEPGCPMYKNFGRIFLVPLQNGIPKHSMNGICTYIWLSFMVNVGKYTIHWASGIKNSCKFCPTTNHLSNGNKTLGWHDLVWNTDGVHDGILLSRLMKGSL